MRRIRHTAEAADAAAVLIATGNPLVSSYASMMVNAAVLAAVSPNRQAGPWINAGMIPL